jgi:signal transduction histidine kinase
MPEPTDHPTPAPDETAAQPAGVILSPALRAELFSPEHWHESLDAYASTTHLAVALVNTAGHLLGACFNPQPTWSLLHAHQEAADGGCPFALASRTPCTCVGDALVKRELVLVRDRTGLVHFTVPLVLGAHPLGALLAGQVFDQYPEIEPLEHVARHCGLPLGVVWQRARLEPPVKRATLHVYGRLLAALGNAYLQTRYHMLLGAQRLEALEQGFRERTTALYHETAERQRQDLEAHRNEHFTLLGRLAAGVSHELRNPLAAVFLQVELLEEELHQPSPEGAVEIAHVFAELKTQLARVDDLIQDYLSLVRVGTIQRTVQDLGPAVQAWSGEFQALARARGVTLRPDGLATLGPVAFHASTLRRAVLNLVQNALDAMPQGGWLTLAGRGTATQVQVSVQDTGSGIPAALLAQIFAPLYTTKPGGTGLGLYIVQEIVTAHEGQLTVQSVEGQGSTFTITLPRAPRAASVPDGAEGAQTNVHP